MPPKSSSRRHHGHVVTTVVVCHNGAATLGEVLDSLASQRRQPERLVAVDLGSTDDTRSIVTDRHGRDTLVALDADTAFADAVQAGLDAFGAPRRRTVDVDDDAAEVADLPVEWIWLLHDDSAPDIDALDELLVRVTHSPSVWLVGPKIRDWSGERLVQAGLTIDATGHIDAGLDVGELDQGQLDEVDEVLAVSSAGALIRRDVWDRLGGMDPAWSAYGDEVDLGWRVNAASGRVVVAPRAIMRHVGGGCTTRSADTSMHAAAIRRRNGMQIVLSNTSGRLVPLLMVRYALGGLLRAFGLLVVSRRPSLAGAELTAAGRVITSPQVVITGRRERAQAREVSHSDLRRLFPAAASRWRNSPFVAGLSAPETTTRRRRSVAIETGPVSEEAESLSNEISVFGAFIRRPASVLFLVMSLLALIADRHVLSSTIHGGRLLPSPNGASDLWSTYTAAWHPAGVGSTTATPTSIAALAMLSTVLLGKAWLAVDVLVLGAVPLAALSAFTAMRVLTPAVRIRVWASIVYALLPSVTGAVAGGRLDVIVAAIVLPRIVRSFVVALDPVAPGTMRGRSVRAALWLAIGAAFAPLLWVIAVAGLLIVAVVRALSSGDSYDGDEPTESGPSLRASGAIIAVILGVPLVLLLPWTFHLIAHPGLLVSGSGLPEFYTAHGAPSGISLALLRAGGAAQPPVWIGIPVLAAAVLGLQRDSRVAVARVAAIVFIGGVAAAVALTRSAGITPGAPATRHWPGLVLLVAGAAAVVSATVAAIGARPALRDRSFGWRQPAAVGVVVLAVAATGTLGVGWLIRGSDKPLTGHDPVFLPLFTQAEMAVSTTPRALVLRAAGPQISYSLLRRATGPVLGDAETAPTHGQSAAANKQLGRAVRDLIAGLPGAGSELVPFGIKYVVAPDSSVHRIGSALGRSTTLSVVPAPGATVWRSTLPTGELNLFSGAAVAAAKSGKVPSEAPTAVLAATPGKADVPVRAGTGTRLAVLAEPAGSQWHASYDGKALTKVTAYGWAQAFEVPSGAGQLKIWSSGGGREFWIWLELIALVAVVGVGVAAAPRRPQRDVL